MAAPSHLSSTSPGSPGASSVRIYTYTHFKDGSNHFPKFIVLRKTKGMSSERAYRAPQCRACKKPQAAPCISCLQAYLFPTHILADEISQRIHAHTLTNIHTIHKCINTDTHTHTNMCRYTRPYEHTYTHHTYTRARACTHALAESMYISVCLYLLSACSSAI